jgi:glycerol-3-phosphate dehydrogenase
MSKPQAIIIGAGFTGVATAHDLTLRGFDVTVVERGDIACGTSGRTHGLIHSGARYAVKDRESAAECIQENTILRRIVPQMIEQNGGYFIALNESDLAYGELFKEGCQACNIQIEQLSAQQALHLEPNINPKVLEAFIVPDCTFDPLRMALAFAATAKKNGARFRIFHEVTGMLMDGKGQITGVRMQNHQTGEEVELHGDMVINATGAWAGRVAGLAGMEVPVVPTPGVMLAYEQRLAARPIHRLNTPADGDIALAQRHMLVVGTTSFEVKDPDYVPIVDEHVKFMEARGIEMIPKIAQVKVRAIYNAIRPLIGGESSGRSLARTFKCYDHQENGVEGLVTITGGKATTLRLMAEKTADLVCQKLGVTACCCTKDYPLLSFRQYYILPN